MTTTRALRLLCAGGCVLVLACGQSEHKPAPAQTPRSPAPSTAPTREPQTSVAPRAETPPREATARAHGGACRSEGETLLAENTEPARGIAVHIAQGHGAVAWPVSANSVAVQPLSADGTPEGTPRTHTISQARGVHLLTSIGDRFVLVTRGACANPPSPGQLHCTSYLGLTRELAATAPEQVLAYSNQARVEGHAVIDDALYLAYVMETGLDAAGLSAPTFDLEVQRLAFTNAGAFDVSHFDVEEPGISGDEPVHGAFAPCASMPGLCGVVCAEDSNRCEPVGVRSRGFRNPVIGGIPQWVACDAEGCTATFRRGAVVRGRRIGPADSSLVEAPPAPTPDAPLRVAVENGAFVRRDISGASIGEPLAVAPRDARAYVTFTGHHFLVASAQRRGRSTRYLLTKVACDPSPGS